MARILIVDDDAALRDTLAAAVADLGHVPLEAGDGAEALAMIQAGSADAVILDLRMAGMDGLEVLRRLQGSHPPPITVLTAHATAANTIEAMRLGAVDHLTKPITQAELKRVIETMLMSGVTAGPIARRDLGARRIRRVERRPSIRPEGDRAVGGRRHDHIDYRRDGDRKRARRPRDP